MFVSPAKTAETDRDAIWENDTMGGKVGRIYSPPREEPRRRLGLLSKFFHHLLLLLLFNTPGSNDPRG